ncbi:hypothetical protein [Actinoallomurus sp. NPDC050550]|uniref:hypothetical protein n=1 Tax=Actinoallomurus sp. NPDC050550 TaxID=3154937 RepID=UPI0033D86EA9
MPSSRPRASQLCPAVRAPVIDWRSSLLVSSAATLDAATMSRWASGSSSSPSRPCSHAVSTASATASLIAPA